MTIHTFTLDARVREIRELLDSVAQACGAFDDSIDSDSFDDEHDAATALADRAARLVDRVRPFFNAPAATPSPATTYRLTWVEGGWICTGRVEADSESAARQAWIELAYDDATTVRQLTQSELADYGYQPHLISVEVVR